MGVWTEHRRERLAEYHAREALKVAEPDLLDVCLRDGGATLDAAALRDGAGRVKFVRPTAGFAVGYGQGATLPAGAEYGAGRLRALAVTVARLDPEASHVGLWLHDGLVDVDPVMIVADFHDAVTLGRQHAQLAVYSFADGEDCPL